MSYQVLARKWRPRVFAEMAGQEHVLRAIINALDNDRLHHAFLFTGTRGVGKTTIARILAKSLNCEQGVSSTPCGQCSACVEIDEGRFIDLIEVDAASRTKVEDTRELLDNVQYAPTRGRYKVYLIDEVHMLSKHSFNALLKTLEEPPPHIKFLLATTDPQKLPVTILSRCLQFNLKRLPRGLISSHLAHILEQENISCEAAALSLLAQAADGSMRDALSLLDQAIAFCGGSVLADDVRTMLGTIDGSHVFDLLEALACGDGAVLLENIDAAAEQSPEYSGLLEALLSVLHRIALVQLVPALQESTEDAGDDDERIGRFAAQFSAEDIQLYYQIGLIGRRDLGLAPDPRSGFEMILLRMLAFRPVSAGQPAPPLVSQGRRETPPSGPDKPQAAPRSEEARAESPAAAGDDDWGRTIQSLALTGLPGQLAANCQLQRRSDQQLHLLLDEAHTHLCTEQTRQRLEKSLQTHYGHAVKLVIDTGTPGSETPAARQQREHSDRLRAAEDEIRGDENVRKLQQAFNARIVTETIQPID